MKFKIPKVNFNTDKLKALSNSLFQDRSQKILKDLLELEVENPADMRIKQKIAELYFKQGKTDEAVAKFEEIMLSLEKSDFVLKAIRACQSILKMKPALVDYNLKLAALYLKVGMLNEAANQYRIAINHFAALKDEKKTIALSQDLVFIDPSPENRSKLAEIYQSCGMTDGAIKQYEVLAKEYRMQKNYDKLLHFYELILPHRPENRAILKDVCILYLRKQRPERSLKIMEHYKVLEDGDFQDLVKKAQMMVEALRKHKKAS